MDFFRDIVENVQRGARDIAGRISSGVSGAIEDIQRGVSRGLSRADETQQASVGAADIGSALEQVTGVSRETEASPFDIRGFGTSLSAEGGGLPGFAESLTSVLAGGAEFETPDLGTRPASIPTVQQQEVAQQEGQEGEAGAQQIPFGGGIQRGIQQAARTQSTQFGDVTPPRGFRVGGGGNLIPVPGQEGQAGRSAPIDIDSAGTTGGGTAGETTATAGTRGRTGAAAIVDTTGQTTLLRPPSRRDLEEDEETEAERRANQLAEQQGVPGDFVQSFVDATFDAEDIESVQDEIQQLLSLPEAQVSDDLRSSLQQASRRIRRKLEQERSPEEPVAETPEQESFVANSEDPTGLRQIMDMRRRELGLTSLTKERVKLMKQMNATNEVFRGIISDIKENPNLPSSLARRRIQSVQREQKEIVNQLTAELEVVNQQISDANDALNREFRIASKELSLRRQRRNDAQQNLNIMIESGAVGGMTDQEIQKWSRATGVPTDALEKLRTDANDPTKDLKTLTNIDRETGNLEIIQFDPSEPSKTSRRFTVENYVTPTPREATTETPAMQLFSDRELRTLSNLTGRSINEIQAMDPTTLQRISAGIPTQDDAPRVARQLVLQNIPSLRGVSDFILGDSLERTKQNIHEMMRNNDMKIPWQATIPDPNTPGAVKQETQLVRLPDDVAQQVILQIETMTQEEFDALAQQLVRKGRPSTKATIGTDDE